jgi:large subunit ribosomal protein L4
MIRLFRQTPRRLTHFNSHKPQFSNFKISYYHEETNSKIEKNLTELTESDISTLYSSKQTAPKQFKHADFPNSEAHFLTEKHSGEKNSSTTRKFLVKHMLNNPEKFGKFKLLNGKYLNSEYTLIMVSEKFGVINFSEAEGGFNHLQSALNLVFPSVKMQSFEVQGFWLINPELFDQNFDKMVEEKKLSEKSFEETDFQKITEILLVLLRSRKTESALNVETSEPVAPIQPAKNSAENITNIIKNLNQSGEISKYDTSATKKSFDYTLSAEIKASLPSFRKIPQAEVYKNVEDFNVATETEPKVIELHPDVFAHPMPDIRLLHECVKWQETYKLVDDTHRMKRDENFADPDNPWRMNSGHTRRKDLKGPTMFLGTSRHAVSGPWSMFTEFSEVKQAMAIRHALTVRFVQGDLEVFSQKPSMVKDVEHLLIVAGEFTAPKGMVEGICADSDKINILPVVGLNVLSILKHEKLAIHESVVRTIERNLLQWEQRYPFGSEEDFGDSERHNFYTDSSPIQQSISPKHHNLAYDQIELDSGNKAWKNQHNMEPAVSNEEMWRSKLPAEE